MTKYETVAAFSVVSVDEKGTKNTGDIAKAEALIEKFKALIEANGTLTKLDNWGVRKLAYEVNYEKEANYVVYTFEADEAFVAELERVFGITDGVLRFLTTKAFATAEVEEAEDKADEEEVVVDTEEATVVIDE